MPGSGRDVSPEPRYSKLAVQAGLHISFSTFIHDTKMPGISSSKATFTSLSVRSFKFGGYSVQDKVDLFENAVSAVKTILGDTSRAKPVTPAPELMRLVFERNSHDPQLETIREVLRPTTHFGFHTLSALKVVSISGCSGCSTCSTCSTCNSAC